jgi:hypothetical protein
MLLADIHGILYYFPPRVLSSLRPPVTSPVPLPLILVCFDGSEPRRNRPLVGLPEVLQKVGRKLYVVAKVPDFGQLLTMQLGVTLKYVLSLDIPRLKGLQNKFYVLEVSDCEQALAFNLASWF